LFIFDVAAGKQKANFHSMKCICFLCLFFALKVYSQNDTGDNRNAVFSSGIYTSFDEIIRNSPKYQNCKLSRVVPVFGYLPYYQYNDSTGKPHDLNDSIFAVVDKNMFSTPC